jgi:hypothetical protein
MEVMLRLAVLENGFLVMVCSARRGQFMETFFYYPCWAVRVGVDFRVLALTLVVVVVVVRF